MSYTSDGPKKHLGQHFLHDRAVIEKIIDCLNPRPEDIVVEIGPGRGALTAKLLGRVASLHVVEIDEALVTKLEHTHTHPTIHIHRADALAFDYCRLAGSGDKIRVLGNLPYNISTPLLFRLIEHGSCIADMCLMLQKEVVDRISAVPGTKLYGRLSVMMQQRCAVRRLFYVAAGAFSPRPKVESAVIHIVPHAASPYSVLDPDRFATIVRLAFSQRRKTLRNALGSVLDESMIVAAGVNPQHRAEQITIAEFAALSRQT